MRQRKEQPAYKLGLKYMEQNCGMTAVQLTESLGIARRNVSQYIKLWLQDGVKIIDWQETKRGYAPVYGFGKEKKKPPTKTDAENAKTYRKKFGVLLNIKKRIAYKNKCKNTTVI